MAGWSTIALTKSKTKNWDQSFQVGLVKLIGVEHGFHPVQNRNLNYLNWEIATGPSAEAELLMG